MKGVNKNAEKWRKNILIQNYKCLQDFENEKLKDPSLQRIPPEYLKNAPTCINFPPPPPPPSSSSKSCEEDEISPYNWKNHDFTNLREMKFSTLSHCGLEIKAPYKELVYQSIYKNNDQSVGSGENTTGGGEVDNEEEEDEMKNTSTLMEEEEEEFDDDFITKPPSSSTSSSYSASKHDENKRRTQLRHPAGIYPTNLPLKSTFLPNKKGKIMKDRRREEKKKENKRKRDGSNTNSEDEEQRTKPIKSHPSAFPSKKKDYYPILTYRVPTIVNTPDHPNHTYVEESIRDDDEPTIWACPNFNVLILLI